MYICSQLCSASEIAYILGLSESRIHALRRQGIIEQAEDEKYMIPETVQAYIRYKTEALKKTDGNNYEEERARLTKAKREKAEIELAEIKCELHQSEDVEAIWGDMIGAFRAKILGIPTKLSPLLVNKTIVQIKQELERVTNEALKDLSNYDPSYFHIQDKNISKNEGGN